MTDKLAAEIEIQRIFAALAVAIKAKPGGILTYTIEEPGGSATWTFNLGPVANSTEAVSRFSAWS